VFGVQCSEVDGFAPTPRGIDFRSHRIGETKPCEAELGSNESNASLSSISPSRVRVGVRCRDTCEVFSLQGLGFQIQDLMVSGFGFKVSGVV
jgi:hypothetical protein